MKTQIPVSNYSFDGVAKGIITCPLTQQIVEDQAMVNAASYKTSFVQVFETVSVNYVNPAISLKSANGQITFSTSVTGALADASVTWTSTGGTWADNVWTAPAQPGVYTITATSDEDTSVFAIAQVTVVANPVATSITGAANITLGLPMITAVFSGGRGFVDQGVGEVASGIPFAPLALASGVKFTLTVWNIAGTSTSKASTNMNVVETPVAVSLTADVNPVTSGTKATLTPTFTGGTASIDKGVGVVTSGTPIQTGNLVANTTFTLTVTNAAGTTSTKTLLVTIA